MTLSISDVEEWASRGESETQEFKVRTSTGCRREAAETICGMLNGQGGRVIFGVDQDGHVVGQTVSDKTLEQVVAEFSRIEPAVSPEVDRIPAGTGEVIVASVGRSHRRPHSYKGQAYARIGNTTVAISREQYHEMLLEAHHANQRWESEIASGWDVSDLDQSEIARTVDEAVRRGRLEEPGTRDAREMLRGLGVLTADGLLRAAVVLFARSDNLVASFPQCRVRLARFRGTDKTEFIDNRQFHGNAFTLLSRADQFLRAHLPVAGRIQAGVFERTDDPIYPPVALREALANALCHRDYSIGGGSVGIAIYDDRLEITSSGGLHFGLEVADLYRPHESLPWNPTIADVFYRRGIIETWGRGTLKMTQLTAQAGLPRPEFENSPGALLVRFRPSSYMPPKRIGHDLSQQQQDILQVLAVGGEQALQRVVATLGAGVERRSVQRDLHFLRSLDLVETVGWGRGAKWGLKHD
ncbi:ATP-binding protein [Conexibacter sp. SYSU D00693]|uniref:ATP-binding protein n=1 Tax=Conexibacter sp. SYSU D00693 TaxID=2812560 RepID=UPI00196A8F97|nr:ATP-binding protein [Conexibacter sp. SYSU D00693]